jgi:peptidoglycan/xylan/chitin deacetylase (PgdA/CDA1 family)
MPRSFYTFAFAALLASPSLAEELRPTIDPAPALQKPQQIVIISYDGAGDNRLWDRSRATARAVGASYTYFLSCTLVLDRTTSGKSYQAPGKGIGRSNIGFGQSRDEVKTRFGNIAGARREGHEIASHTCGHFDGGKWSAEEWQQEFSSFQRHLNNAWDYIGASADKPDDWEAITASIKGFRAPYLSQSKALDQVIKKNGFTYDATTVSKGPEWPKNENGILKFSLPLIPEGPKQKPIIAMDYNLFVRHSMAIEQADRAQEYADRAYSAFRAAFDKQYSGTRIPLQMGFHFVKMNGGAYWDAHEKLLREVCGLSDVACLSYEKAIPLINERLKDKTAG